MRNFGKLKDISNLKYGSGLEGFIAKTVGAQLGIPLTVDFRTLPKEVIIRLTLTKGVRRLHKQ